MVEIAGTEVPLVSGLDTTIMIIIGLIGLGVVAFLIILLVNTAQYKHKFRVREIINGRKIVIDDRAREINEKGVTYWKLLKKKDKIHVPPADAIDIDFKGKKVVESYRTSSGEYIYINDIGKISEVPKEILEIQEPTNRARALNDWKKKNGVIDAFYPLTTNQRQLYINEIKKAMMRKSSKWQDYILPTVSIGALVIIVIALMVFWGDIAKPAIQARELGLQQVQVMNENTKILQEMKQDIQNIRGDDSRQNVPD